MGWSLVISEACERGSKLGGSGWGRAGGIVHERKAGGHCGPAAAVGERHHAEAGGASASRGGRWVGEGGRSELRMEWIMVCFGDAVGGVADVQKMGSVRKLTGSSRLPSRIRKTAWWGPNAPRSLAPRYYSFAAWVGAQDLVAWLWAWNWCVICGWTRGVVPEVIGGHRSVWAGRRCAKQESMILCLNFYRMWVWCGRRETERHGYSSGCYWFVKWFGIGTNMRLMPRT